MYKGYDFVRTTNVGRVKKDPNAPMLKGVEVTELSFEDGWNRWFDAVHEVDARARERAWSQTQKAPLMAEA